MVKCLTLAQLEEIERAEYNTLDMLSHMALEYKEEGNIKMYHHVEESIKWQRGRWGIIDEIIEQLKKEGEQNNE